MTSKNHMARVLASLAVLCNSVPVFAKDAESSAHNTGTETTSKCPVMAETKNPIKYPTAAGAFSNQDWWPNQLNLKILDQNSSLVDPMDRNFNYAAEFKKVDLEALKSDINTLMHTSQDWWPADFGTYSGLFIRMAWHSAGTYRVADGRGGASYGTQRFAPLNSWPDNANLDKARRLLWPVKQKYGKSVSWADLMVLAGNCALESTGLKTFGYAGGREDRWEPQEDIFWGPESVWLGDKRYDAGHNLDKPLAAVQMGLIYVNPEGPDGKPDPIAAAKDIRETFGRMAMNDEETVSLIAGGHTLGKTHGAAVPGKYVGPEPEGAPLEEQGFGWKNSYKSGKADDAITSGLEGSWTSTPAKFSNGYLDNLLGFDWVVGKGPGGAFQWSPKEERAKGTVPDAFDKTKMHDPIMFTTDIALKMDPAYLVIIKRFHENPAEFRAVFAKAWYKLTHRDMGPVSRLLGPAVPPAQLWQDPVPVADYKMIDVDDIASLKSKISASGLTIPQLVTTAWASASTFRGSDKRGGANGARLRLAPQKDWAVNNPAELSKVLQALEKIQGDFNAAQTGGKKVSLADLIVLGGCVGVEAAAKAGGHEVQVPFLPGRTDASQEQTDIESVAYLELKTDGFRNFRGQKVDRPAEQLLIDRAQLLTLSGPEMTVLVGGMRSLIPSADGAELGVLTKRPQQLTNDFFVNLLNMDTVWKKSAGNDHRYEGHDRKTGTLKWTATPVDLIFGSNSQLRAISEVYACDDAQQKFVNDFVKAWTKVMNSDRFDVDASQRNGGIPVALLQK